MATVAAAAVAAALQTATERCVCETVYGVVITVYGVAYARARWLRSTVYSRQNELHLVYEFFSDLERLDVCWVDFFRHFENESPPKILHITGFGE